MSFSTEVIMVLAPASTSREVMLVAQELGYTNGEFVFFMITNPDIDQVTKDIWKQNDTEDEVLFYLSLFSYSPVT